MPEWLKANQSVLLVWLVSGLILIGYWQSLRFNLHMFQLNSYKRRIHFVWLCRNVWRCWRNYAAAVPALLLLARRDWNVVTVAASAAILLFALYPSRSQKAKKPLVYTARGKRLLFTAVLLLGAGVWVCGFFSDSAGNALGYWAAAAAIFVLLPFLVIAADLLNTPVEWSVRFYYTCDAKRRLKSMSNLTVIGVTGSYGKTSMKYFLQSLLQVKYNCLMTPESFNTPMGVVRTVRERLRPIHEVFICEMGARRVGEIKELCQIVKPKHGVITSIGLQHLETFKKLDNIVKTKFELAAALPDDGKLFLNHDSEYIARHDLNGRPAIYYGTDKSCAYWADKIAVSERGTSFVLHGPDKEKCEFDTRLIGEHNAVNLVGALAVACQLGIKMGDLRNAVRHLEPVPHRLELIESGPLTIIDDAYNSNPAGCEAALRLLGRFEDKFKIMITPGMVELGVQQDERNHAFGMQAATVCDYLVLVGEKQTLSVRYGATDAGLPADKIYVADNITEALQKVYAMPVKKRKIVLLENDLPDNY